MTTPKITGRFQRSVDVTLAMDLDRNCPYIELYCFRRTVRVYDAVPTRALYAKLVEMLR